MLPWYWVVHGGRFYAPGPAPPPPAGSEWLRQEAIRTGRYLTPE
jgi:hypothetical protein